jgi:urea transport system permease protein
MGPFPLTRLLDRSATVFLVLLAAFAIAIPVLNLLMPAGSPLHVSTYLVALFGKYICYAMLALSIDLIWGYAGILSLGHGAFFALGGYAMGMYLMRQIGTRGVYANPMLPDFMVFLNWQELPFYWYGFNHFAYAALMIFLVPGLLAFVFGWFAFRSRVTGVYLVDHHAGDDLCADAQLSSETISALAAITASPTSRIFSASTYRPKARATVCW